MTYAVQIEEDALWCTDSEHESFADAAEAARAHRADGVPARVRTPEQRAEDARRKAQHEATARVYASGPGPCKACGAATHAECWSHAEFYRGSGGLSDREREESARDCGRRM